MRTPSSIFQSLDFAKLEAAPLRVSVVSEFAIDTAGMAS
jgi:hypothetical protein